MAWSSGQRLAVAFVGAFVAALLSLGLTACSEAQECSPAAGCAKLLKIPTGSAAKHTDGQLTGVTGTLTAIRVKDRVCLRLRPSVGRPIALVLPEGTSAAATGKPEQGADVAVTVIGPNGLGGLRTGDRLAVTPDRRRATAKAGVCPRGPVIDTGWVIRLPTDG